MGDEVAGRWLKGLIPRAYDVDVDHPVPDRPARLENVKLVSPSEAGKSRNSEEQGRRSFIDLCILKAGQLTCLGVSQARGLDVLPTTISRFRNGGDSETAELLEKVVYPEEITHCAVGVKWLKYLCLRSKDPVMASDSLLSKESEAIEAETSGNFHGEVIQKFHTIVRTFFRGPLKPPFNESARRAAGFGPQWYDPLAVKGIRDHSLQNEDIP